MARSGVGDGTTVVLYDDTQNLFASRVWWSLRAYGFDSARLLDGGYPAWATEARTVSNAQQRAADNVHAARPARNPAHDRGHPSPAGLARRADPRRTALRPSTAATRAMPSDSGTFPAP